MELFYRRMLFRDLAKWGRMAEEEFLEGDFCDIRYLLKNQDDIKGWILFAKPEGGEEEWIGACFLDFEHILEEPPRIHFLEMITFPKYRGQGVYVKCLGKIMFDNSKGFAKSASIQPTNSASRRVAEKFGFKKVGSDRIWDDFRCDAEYYPPELLHFGKILRKASLTRGEDS